MSYACPECQSTELILLTQRTSIGYKRFRCKSCLCTSNERSGTVFSFLEYPTDLVLMGVRWRLRYCLSLRNLSELMLEIGFEFTHETVRFVGREIYRKVKILLSINLFIYHTITHPKCSKSYPCYFNSDYYFRHLKLMVQN